MNNNMKTYRDSYLYKTKLDSMSQDSTVENKNNKVLSEYIKNTHRIEDKKSSAFRGIIEDLKRYTRSNILLTVLMQDNVKLCIGPYELPKAFKVFDAKDVKSKILEPCIFIDCSGIIEYKDMYYVCKKVDVLATYLSEALIYILYRYHPHKLLNNSVIVNFSTECYINSFSYIIDYLGVTGYSANKTTVKYFIGLFYLVNMVGKPLDIYTKQISAKIAEVTTKDLRILDVYMDDGMFDNINSFLEWLNKTFFKANINGVKSGLTLGTFVSKWAKLYGPGTIYGMELFTSYLKLIIDGASGAYIINQNQVRKSCGDLALFKVQSAIDKAGMEIYSHMLYAESYLEQDLYKRTDKNTVELAEAMNLKNSLTVDDITVTVKEFSSLDKVNDKLDSIIKICNEARITDRLNDFAYNSIINGLEAANNSIKESSAYEYGTLGAVCKKFKNKVNDKQRYLINTEMNNSVYKLREMVNENNSDEGNKELAMTTAKLISEIKNSLAYV